MIGTILNVAGILVGGTAGLLRPKPLSRDSETFFKAALGVFTIYFGLRLVWLSLSGSLFQVLRQAVILVLALMLGRLAGQLLGLQNLSNRLGRFARQRMDAAGADRSHRFGDGFRACTALFCAAPLGWVGAVQDGLSGYPYPLVVKAVMECLAAMGLVSVFGRGVLLSALPVLTLQGTLTLVCGQVLKPLLEARALVDSINAAGGMVVFCVALVILGMKRIELADYLPSLFFAPLLTWVWK